MVRARELQTLLDDCAASVVANTDRIVESAEPDAASAGVHAAEELLLRRAPDADVKGELPEIHSDVRKHLDASDPRRLRFEALLSRAHDAGSLDAESVENVVSARAAAKATYRQEVAQLRDLPTYCSSPRASWC